MGYTKQQRIEAKTRALRATRIEIASYEREEWVLPDPDRLEMLRGREQRLIALLRELGAEDPASRSGETP